MGTVASGHPPWARFLLPGVWRCSDLPIATQPVRGGASDPILLSSPPLPSHPCQPLLTTEFPALLAISTLHTASSLLPHLPRTHPSEPQTSPSSHGSPPGPPNQLCPPPVLWLLFTVSVYLCLHVHLHLPPRDTWRKLPHGFQEVGLGGQVGPERGAGYAVQPTLVMLKLTLKLCPSPSTCHTHTLQARSLVLGLTRSRVKVQYRYCCVPFQM